jgi:hypothetical protein
MMAHSAGQETGSIPGQTEAAGGARGFGRDVQDAVARDNFARINAATARAEGRAK